jgi:hypothetical protein
VLLPSRGMRSMSVHAMNLLPRRSTARSSLRIVDSIHEDGAKLVEATDDAINNSAPAIRVCGLCPSCTFSQRLRLGSPLRTSRNGQLGDHL